MKEKEIYSELHKNEVIANLEKKDGVWYIENSVDEYRSKPTSYYPSLKEAVDGLSESSDWFLPKGTGTICFTEFGIGKKRTSVYMGGYESGKILV